MSVPSRPPASLAWGPSLLGCLVLGCHATTTTPVVPPEATAAPPAWEATCAAAAGAADLGALSKLPAKWTRLALLEGQWKVPPGSGTLPPVEVETRGIAPVLHIRNGAGEQTYAIRGAVNVAGGSVGLLLVDDNPGACAAFVPWASAGLGGAPPDGAWVVVTPGMTPAADVAWYPMGEGPSIPL